MPFIWFLPFGIHWLKDNLVIHELKYIDHSNFMVNPYIVMNNSDRNERISECARRLKLEDAKIKKNRELKCRRELKKPISNKKNLRPCG